MRIRKKDDGRSNRVAENLSILFVIVFILSVYIKVLFF
jgi:hypothetical protein